MVAPAHLGTAASLTLSTLGKVLLCPQQEVGALAKYLCVRPR